DGTAQLWDVATGIPLGPPLLNRGPTLGVSFHPDGRGLATASGDGNVRFWGVVTAPWSLQDRMDLWREAGALMEFDFSGLVRELDEPSKSTHPGKDECGELCHE